MSEIEERFISTPQQELEYQKRKNSELLSYAEKNHKLIEELMARAEKAEAALESAQKMCDHWESKATERQQQFNECRAMLGERIELLRENLDEWARIARENEARAEKAEAEIDELKFQKDPAEPIDWELFCAQKRSMERQRDLANPVDWGRVRIDAAIAMIQGMWACPDTNFKRPMPGFAVACADALVAELQKKEVQE